MIDRSFLQEVKVLLESPDLKCFPGINGLTRICFVSPSTLKTEFRKKFGYSLYCYYNIARLNRARSLLESGLYYCEEVALMVGYSKSSLLAIAYKKQFGILPSASRPAMLESLGLKNKTKFKDMPSLFTAIADLLSSPEAKTFPGIEAISIEFSVSPSKLKKRFRLIYGMTLYQYYNKMRLERARTMILSGCQVKEAALTVGYANKSHFSKAFRDALGIYPRSIKNGRRESEQAVIPD